ncbi:MAG: arginine--tRNA ligase [Alphaproteobacteria bacterium]|nr:arginine--tRNA ligase [Alphaproteobacteria bacterium]
MTLSDLIKDKAAAAFTAAGFGGAETLTRPSDRPDIGDYQINGALAYAKVTKQNPRVVADAAAAELRKDAFFASVSVDGPGFVNLKIADDALGKLAPEILGSGTCGYAPAGAPTKIVMDYGGPNVAKILHAGHLPSANLGEAVLRLCRFAGDVVVGENYLGDWGRPMGLMIEAVREKYPDLPYFDAKATAFPKHPPFTNDDLIDMYPAASARIKTDADFLARARESTRLLQEGHAGYRALWRQFLDMSVASMKKTYDRLGIRFDVWTGESAAYDRALQLAAAWRKDGTLKLDDGAWIIPLDAAASDAPLPPVIVLNSVGGITYAASDLATIARRADQYHPDIIIYSVDARQSLHLKQVFDAARQTGLAPGVSFENFAFGAVCGADRKPFKTRDGGVMPLDTLIDTAVQSVKARMDAGEIGRGLTDAEKAAVAEKVGVSALKFAGLINDKTKDCVLDIDKITQVEGRTGPYILYTIVRMKAVLDKVGAAGDKTPVMCAHPAERALLLRLYAFPDAVQAAYANRAPHMLADYVFKLAQDFNLFYHDCPIRDAGARTRAARLALTQYTLRAAQSVADILGLMVPDKM